MGVPTGGGPRRIGDWWRALRDLERRVDYLASAQNLVGRAALAAGRSLVLKDGGSVEVEGGNLVLRSTTGRALFHLGAITAGEDNPQRGWIVRRDGDETIALVMSDADISDGIQQALMWRDRAGHTVLSDDTNSAQGLARPYIPMQFTSANDVVTQTAGAWGVTHSMAAHWQHPRASVAISANCPVGTAGEVRLVDGDGAVLAGPTVIPDGGGIAPFWTVTLPAHTHMSYRYLHIEARRTSGTGGVAVRPWYAAGVQSP